jgi:hypothetical protein
MIAAWPGVRACGRPDLHRVDSRALPADRSTPVGPGGTLPFFGCTGDWANTNRTHACAEVRGSPPLDWNASGRRRGHHLSGTRRRSRIDLVGTALVAGLRVRR